MSPIFQIKTERMVKTYMATTSLSLSVRTPKGKSKYVAFKVQTDGRSIFRTSDPDLQKGLESHYKFNRSFREIEVERSKITSDAVLEDTPKKAKETGPVKLKVTDISDAREQIARKTGISRSKLRKPEDIFNAAKANNIIIVGLDVK